MTKRIISQAQLRSLLSSLSTGEVLVGGQALQFWVGYYGISSAGYIPFTRDADILGGRDTVERISKVLRGVTVYPPAQGFGTVLVGEIQVGKKEPVGIDVLHSVPGIDRADVVNKAITVYMDDVRFHVMHPLHCFTSKIFNLATFEDKQNDQGIFQARLALEVATAYISALVDANKEKEAIQSIEYIAKTARLPIGRKVPHLGINVYDAIPEMLLQRIRNSNFRSKRLPRLREAAGRVELENINNPDDDNAPGIG